MKDMRRALPVIAGVFAGIFAPAHPMSPSVWAAQNLVVPDGPYAGERFHPELTPYLVEPLDFFSSECLDNKCVIRKSAQTGFTLLAIAAIGYSIDREPCRMMVVQPTDSALSEFNREKLQPAFDQSRALRAKVRTQISRSTQGSTTYAKRYPGGSLTLAIATSTADLRSKTIKKVIKDEASEYPEDLDGQGSPHKMIEARYESFLQTGDWKELSISTPVIKGACYIDAEFEAGDQRLWHVPCPGCGDEFVFSFDLEQFQFNASYPFEARYVAPCCGRPIESHEKNLLIRKGRWIATAPAPGKHRSYHFDALSSPFVPWDTIARRYLEAKQNESNLKTFDNLTLGRAHEVKGDAPPHARLLERRESYPVGVIPSAGLLLAAGADVQHSGIWFEVVAYGRDGQSWSIEHGFVEGDTTDPERGAFATLVEVYERQFDDAFGARRQIDALAIDAGDGGRANQVYAWCRNRHRAFAVKGVSGWTAPAIGTPARVSITLKGKKLKGGATLWPVGTWPLKATYYGNLRKDGRKAGAETDPPGYCHHHQNCDERYFRQQTAEYLKTVTVRGRTTKVWQETGPNHLLDCRIYAMAMVEYLGLSRLRADDWVALERLRGVPPAAARPDLLAPDSVILASKPTLRPVLLQKTKARGRRILSRGIA
ncbi:terminase gpA endonuclease subunit [Bradyrhizobium sp.]|uniref:phage terminase large subunit family protein n=1 Tax=Bradyrhizobium sp. TaxID=376 RepID=UPI0025C4213E|nr:terminase gpA endonuclease subunit [Bradyrhizobium sp.]